MHTHMHRPTCTHILKQLKSYKTTCRKHLKSIFSSLDFKTRMEGELTTDSGNEFQIFIILTEKKCFLELTLECGVRSLSECPWKRA